MKKSILYGRCVLTLWLATGMAWADPAIQQFKSGTVLDWDMQSISDLEFRSDHLTWTVHPVEVKSGEDPAFLLSIKVADAPVNKRLISAHNPAVQFMAGRFDPSLPEPQLILSTYSGGNACCAKRFILLYRPDGWQYLSFPAGAYDSDLSYPQDLDGDGAPDFVLTDERFAYAFDNFANSWLPPRLFRLRNGAIEDESNSRRFDDFYRKDMAAAQVYCARHILGACAGYVADAARLGQLETGWQFMLSNYCRDAAECSAGSTFPRDLMKLLVVSDYVPAEEAEKRVGSLTAGP